MKQKIVIILFLIVISLNFAIAQTHVATLTKVQNNDNETISKAFSSASTPGNLIIVSVSWDTDDDDDDDDDDCDDDEIRVSSVTDNKGNVYNRIGNTTTWNNGNNAVELWYSYNIKGGGSPINVTATFNEEPENFSRITISEYSGMSVANPFNDVIVATGTSSNVTTGNITTQNSDQLIFGLAVSTSGTLSAGNGFSARLSTNNVVIEDKNAPTAGTTQNATFSSTGGKWMALMAVFNTATSSPLPIELTSFDVYEGLDKTVLLSWQTASETNNNEFEMYRSADGYDWELIGSQKGAGNSTRAINYTASDLSPLTGANYYRLKQIDFDGTSTYSEIKYISIDPKKSNVRVYPNPTNGEIFIESGITNASDILITNALGEILPIVKEKTNDTTYKLDLSNLPKGIYFISSPFITEKIIRN